MLKKFLAFVCASLIATSVLSSPEWVIILKGSQRVSMYSSEIKHVGAAVLEVEMQTIFRPGTQQHKGTDISKVTATVQIDCAARTTLVTKDRIYSSKHEVLDTNVLAAKDKVSPPTPGSTPWIAMNWICGSEDLRFDKT